MWDRQVVVEEAPPDFRIQSIDIPSMPVGLDDPATVTAQITNVGGAGGQEVTLDVEGGAVPTPARSASGLTGVQR